MSWDIYAAGGTRGVALLEDLPEGFAAPVIGAPEQVIDQVREVAPHVEVVDLSWLRLVGDDHSIEISLGKAAQVRDVTFFIHSGEGAAVDVVRRVCRQLGVMPYDTETGERLTDESRPPQPPPPDDDDEPPKRRWWRR